LLSPHPFQSGGSDAFGNCAHSHARSGLSPLRHPGAGRPWGIRRTRAGRSSRQALSTACWPSEVTRGQLGKGMISLRCSEGDSMIAGRPLACVPNCLVPFLRGESLSFSPVMGLAVPWVRRRVGLSVRLWNGSGLWADYGMARPTPRRMRTPTERIIGCVRKPLGILSIPGEETASGCSKAASSVTFLRVPAFMRAAQGVPYSGFCYRFGWNVFGLAYGNRRDAGRLCYRLLRDVGGWSCRSSWVVQYVLAGCTWIADPWGGRLRWDAGG
jgi:hypothetical protein